jgi:molybdenum cofactor biosynthesis protein B
MLADHRKKSPNKIACKVITVSDTRTSETDKSGKKIKELLTHEGHGCEFYEIVPDERLLINNAIQNG